MKSAGSTACESLLVKCAVPTKLLLVVPPTGFFAVTVKLNEVPVLAEPGAATVKLGCNPKATQAFAAFDHCF